MKGSLSPLVPPDDVNSPPTDSGLTPGQRIRENLIDEDHTPMEDATASSQLGSSITQMDGSTPSAVSADGGIKRDSKNVISTEDDSDSEVIKLETGYIVNSLYSRVKKKKQKPEDDSNV